MRSAAPQHEQLRRLLVESPRQIDRLARLEGAIAAKLSELGQTAAVRRAEGFDAARAIIVQGRARQSMDQVRVQVSAIAVAEHQLLIERQRVGRARERDTLLVGVCMVALSVGLRVLIAWLLARLRKRGQFSLRTGS